MKFLNHNLFTGDITVNGTTTLSTATGVTRATGDNSTHLATTAFVKAQGYATTAALAGYVPTTRTLTINGTTYDLSANRSWTISSADGYISNVALVDSTLSFTGVGSAFSGIVDLSTLIPTVRTVYETVKNVSGATILKGTPLAVVAGQTSGNVSDVIPADAADPTKMPAVFIANENIADEAEGEAVLFGNITGVDTSLYQSGTTVYVAPGGGWTATKPIYPNLIQNLGVITKQHATNGAGIVTGVGRANALPNLTAGKIWVGSANYPIESTTVHVDEVNNRVGIGTTNPTEKLTVAGELYFPGISTTDGTNVISFSESTDKSFSFKAYYNGTGASGNKFGIGSNVSGWATNIMTWQGDGNVGIGGITNPSTRLHLYQAATTPSLLTLHNYAADISPGNGNFIEFKMTDDNATATPQVKIGMVIGTEGGSDDGIATEGDGNFVIQTINATGSTGTETPVERMRVTHTGKVGINTTTPNRNLSIVGQLSIDNNEVASSTAGMLFSADSTSNKIYSRIANNNSTALPFEIISGSSSSLYISTGGNVGIGTTGPAYKLDVDGGPIRITNGFSEPTLEAGYRLKFADNGGINNDSGIGLSGALGNESLWINKGSANGNIRFMFGTLGEKVTFTSGGNVGIGIATPTNKLQVANGNMSITTGYSFILADTDTNWRLGRNIIVESGNYLTASTFQLVAANAANEGWQFVNDDGFTVLEIGALTTARHVWINAGNLSVGVASPQEKIHVAGNVRIDGGSTAAILETNNATAAEAGTTYRTFTTADHYAVFVDYVIYDAGRANMRTGTFRAVWTTGDVVYTDVSTVDLGATDNVVLSAAISGANLNLIVTGPADYTLKYNLKVIK